MATFWKELSIRLVMCSYCIISICNFSFFPFWFWERGQIFRLLQFLFIAYLLLLQQGYWYYELRNTFLIFYRRHYEMVSKLVVGLKTILHQNQILRWLCTSLKQIFPISIINELWYVTNVLATTYPWCDRHSACLTESRLTTILRSLIARWWVGYHKLWWSRLRAIN